MTAWTTISNALVAVGAKPFASTMQALRDNVVAAFEGDTTAVAAGITLKDPALDTGAATAAGIAWVGLRTAGLAVGAVGSYAFLRMAVSGTHVEGTTHAGSGLRYSNAEGRAGANAPAGTWRIMGVSQNVAPQSENTTLFLRIS